MPTLLRTSSHLWAAQIHSVIQPSRTTYPRAATVVKTMAPFMGGGGRIIVEPRPRP